MPSAWSVWLKRLSWFVGDYEPNSGLDADDLTATWVRQFETSAQVPLMRALATALETTYISREAFTNYFQNRITNEEFWRDAFFLNGPAEGESGAITYQLVADEVERKFDAWALGDQELKWHTSARHVFVDDAIFTGDRAIKDYGQWWDTPPDPTDWPQRDGNPVPIRIYIWTYVRHTTGEQSVRDWIHRKVSSSGFSCEVVFVSAHVLEDRFDSSATSDVLWPASLDGEVASQRFSDSAISGKLRRTDSGVSRSFAGVFQDPKDRAVLELELMEAGLGILSQFDKAWAPLGYGRRPFGFGSLSVSYRNCPNNAPLALWWSISSHGWTPLFARSTYLHRAEGAPPTASTGPFDDVPF